MEGNCEKITAVCIELLLLVDITSCSLQSLAQNADDLSPRSVTVHISEKRHISSLLTRR